MSLESLITHDEHEAFVSGSFIRSYDKLGAHACDDSGQGLFFAVWAPRASAVHVVGDMNNWARGVNLLKKHPVSGIWEGKVAEARFGHRYKYVIERSDLNLVLEKSDPYAFYSEIRPNTSSVTVNLSDYAWADDTWMRTREQRSGLASPISIYELHLGSWRHKDGSEAEARAYEACRLDAMLPPITYRELAQLLPDYLKYMGFTHVEFMPVMEHPYDGSWGYQVTGYFSPTSRFGLPEDFMFLVDALHQNDIGVILDIVPAHFAVDAHGLVKFDGEPLYEYADESRSLHPEWGTYVFDFSKPEVTGFLLSHAHFWANKYHIDGFRVDAVASMLYLDYSKRDGEWKPNKYGGRENIEAIEFLKNFNEKLYSDFGGIITIAEESTAWPQVSRPTYVGGLGFGYKWNMGWMHDVLNYCAKDPIFRQHHHSQVTFSFSYSCYENYILPLSHDEVVHGKNSLVRKMPGHWWQKFAGVRALIGFMYGHPGKKLLFMGDELGVWDEWYYKRSLNWDLLKQPYHVGIQSWVRDLNYTLMHYPALYEADFDSQGFEWVDNNDNSQNIIMFLRFNRVRTQCILIVCNFCPEVRYDFRIGVPYGGVWKEILNSDAHCYEGSGIGNCGQVTAVDVPSHFRPFSINIALAPMAVMMFVCGNPSRIRAHNTLLPIIDASQGKGSLRELFKGDNTNRSHNI